MSINKMIEEFREKEEELVEKISNSIEIPKGKLVGLELDNGNYLHIEKCSNFTAFDHIGFGHDLNTNEWITLWEICEYNKYLKEE